MKIHVKQRDIAFWQFPKNQKYLTIIRLSINRDGRSVHHNLELAGGWLAGRPLLWTILINEFGCRRLNFFGNIKNYIVSMRIVWISGSAVISAASHLVSASSPGSHGKKYIWNKIDCCDSANDDLPERRAGRRREEQKKRHSNWAEWPRCSNLETNYNNNQFTRCLIIHQPARPHLYSSGEWTITYKISHNYKNIFDSFKLSIKFIRI